ncbi:gem-associated protein 2-like [Ostrinia furnacalis]|uniref:gem-associated protein 2-like n=1 Tax=Ostrinia furnacalis TaxID=93504 RepID=UPI0010388391|nr:gem-associated protein 2-like [Ostrinia furnacalis]
MTEKCIFIAQKDDEDSDSLSSLCFQISPDVQLKEVPTNGEEYLLKVMKERKKYKTVTTCEKDYTKFAKNQSCFVHELSHAKAPVKLKPTIEWQNIQVADFSDVRMYISRLLAKKSSWPSTLTKAEIETNSINSWKSLFAETEPTLSCVLGLKQKLLDRGLEMLIQLLDEVKKGDTIDHKTGQWIYAFLACTRQPLVSDTVSILRDLARKCAEIRSHINPEEENATVSAAPLNIFICIVARYFRQYDLAD